MSLLGHFVNHVGMLLKCVKKSPAPGELTLMPRQLPRGAWQPEYELAAEHAGAIMRFVYKVSV